MVIRYFRLLKIIICAAVPFLISGIFVYRNSFPGTIANAGIILFLASSVIPAIASMAFTIGIQILPAFLHANAEKPDDRTAFILSGVALVLVLWAAIAATESLLRPFYFGVWGSNISDFSLISTSSIVMGIISTIVLAALNFQEAYRVKAA